jgi:hypothetical protein
MDFEEYNKKAFLLPDGVHSMAAYHAKLYSDGSYQFRIHDCYTGICLRGKLETEQDFDDAFTKLKNLAEAVVAFAFYVEKMKRKNFKNHEQAEAIHN